MYSPFIDVTSCNCPRVLQLYFSIIQLVLEEEDADQLNMQQDDQDWQDSVEHQD